MMDLNELCKQYSVSLELLYQFIEVGILADIRQDVETCMCGDKAIKRLESSICLSSLGLDVKTIKTYILLEESKHDTRKERIKILRQYRDHNLKNIHKTKKAMDCIDCVLHDLQSKKKI